MPIRVTEHHITIKMPVHIRNIGPVIAAVPVRGRRGEDGEYAVACERPDMIAEGWPDRAYGTQTVGYNGSEWVTSGNGHYDLTREEAVSDMNKRAGYAAG
jgi:hypothetical protein